MLKKLRPFFDLDTKLKLVPEDWLKYIEPRIVRSETCWLWDGALDMYGEPLMSFYDPVTKKRTTKRVKVFVAEMFWEGVAGHEVVHTCGLLNCLNFAHFYIHTGSSKRDKVRIVKEKSRAIRRYIANKK